MFASSLFHLRAYPRLQQRQRQREGQKTLGLISEVSNFARAARFLVPFFAVPA